MTPFLRAAIGALALSASPLLAQTPTCVAHIDTLRDTIYAILTPGHPTDEVAPAALTPVVRALTNAEDGMRMIGVVSLGAGPTGPILDLRVGGPPQPPPPAMTELPGPWAFTLHRNGTITGAHALTPSRPTALNGALAPLFAHTGVPYPSDVAADSLSLHVAFRVGHDGALATAPLVIRRIYILPIKQQAQSLPATPRLKSTVPDTAVVQFAVTPDGTVDTTTFYPIRARSQTSLDAIRAALPSLHFAPALALNDCPARTVLSQRFVMHQ